MKIHPLNIVFLIIGVISGIILGYINPDLETYDAVEVIITLPLSFFVVLIGLYLEKKLDNNAYSWSEPSLSVVPYLNKESPTFTYVLGLSALLAGVFGILTGLIFGAQDFSYVLFLITGSLGLVYGAIFSKKLFSVWYE